MPHVNGDKRRTAENGARTSSLPMLTDRGAQTVARGPDDASQVLRARAFPGKAVEGRDALERANPLAPQIEHFGDGATT